MKYLIFVGLFCFSSFSLCAQGISGKLNSMEIGAMGGPNLFHNDYGVIEDIKFSDHVIFEPYIGFYRTLLKRFMLGAYVSSYKVRGTFEHGEKIVEDSINSYNEIMVYSHRKYSIGAEGRFFSKKKGSISPIGNYFSVGFAYNFGAINQSDILRHNSHYNPDIESQGDIQRKAGDFSSIRFNTGLGKTTVTSSGISIGFHLGLSIQLSANSSFQNENFNSDKRVHGDLKNYHSSTNIVNLRVSVGLAKV